MRLTAERIRELCAQWSVSATNGGGISIGDDTEKYRLHRNQIGFHELEYDDLRAACVELTKILLLAGRNTVIDLDHYLLWSWVAELTLGRGGPLSTTVDREIYDLADVTVRAALATVGSPTEEAYRRARDADRLLTLSAREYLHKSSTALSYLCFPFLEAITRRACSDFVDLTGRVTRPFVKSAGGDYAVGRRCSNLGDVVRLLRDQVAEAKLREDLVEILDHLAAIGNSTDGCSVVFDWRNSSLHGEATHNSIGGTIFTLGLVVVLEGLRDDYAAHRQAALERARFELQSGEEYRSPWSYYPPF